VQTSLHRSLPNGGIGVATDRKVPPMTSKTAETAQTEESDLIDAMSLLCRTMAKERLMTLESNNEEMEAHSD
jgi:hypothetical protein